MIMTDNRVFLKIAAVSAVILIVATTSGNAGDKPRRAPEKTTAPAPATPEVLEIPQSVFQIPASPREGRNPFFPTSMTEAPPPVVKAKAKGPDTSSIVLNGISSPPKRTAMVNGRTFEKGESGEIKLASGERVALQCVEIGTDSVVVIVGTQRMELRLRNGI